MSGILLSPPSVRPSVHSSVTPSPPRPLGGIQPNSVCELPAPMRSARPGLFCSQIKYYYFSHYSTLNFVNISTKICRCTPISICTKPLGMGLTVWPHDFYWGRDWIKFFKTLVMHIILNWLIGKKRCLFDSWPLRALARGQKIKYQVFFPTNSQFCTYCY